MISIKWIKDYYDIKSVVNYVVKSKYYIILRWNVSKFLC